MWASVLLTKIVTILKKNSPFYSRVVKPCSTRVLGKHFELIKLISQNIENSVEFGEPQPPSCDPAYAVKKQRRSFEAENCQEFKS